MTRLRSSFVALTVAATAAVVAGALGDGAFFVTQARLTPLRTFGKGGAVRSIVADGRRIDALDFVEVDGEGRIVVAGSSRLGRTRGGADDFSPAVARFLPDGSLDTTFGRKGGVVLGLVGRPMGLAVDAANRPTIVGSFGNLTFPTSETRIDAVRLTAAGDLDPGFSGDGLAVLSWPAALRLARASPVDSGILAGTEQVLGIGILRFAADGALDATYGNLGIADVGGRVNDFAVDAAGGAVVAEDQLVLRLDATGRRDLAFGKDGVLVGPKGGQLEGHSVAIDAGGRIVVIGFETDFVPGVFRFLPSGAPDPFFCEGGFSRLLLGIPVNAQAPQLSLGIPRSGDGPYAMSSTLQFFAPSELSRQIGVFGSLVQSLDPADPAAVTSLVRRDPRTNGRTFQTLYPSIAVRADGRVAYAAGETAISNARGDHVRSTPMLAAVDLTRTVPVAMPEFRIEWNAPLTVKFVDNGNVLVSSGLHVTNAGASAVVNARIAVFLSDDAKIDPTDRRVLDLTSGALGRRSEKSVRIDDLFLAGPPVLLHGRRLLAVINQDGATPEADPTDNVAVSEPLP